MVGAAGLEPMTSKMQDIGSSSQTTHNNYLPVTDNQLMAVTRTTITDWAKW